MSINPDCLNAGLMKPRKWFTTGKGKKLGVGKGTIPLTYIHVWGNDFSHEEKAVSGSPFDHSYVISHSSENIRRAIRTVKKKHQVVLEGFLVNSKGTYKEQPVAWNTSLSRTDAGNGSCEFFYVSKVRIDTKVYE